MSSSTDPLLTSLCGICKRDLPKYKCPRCAFRTCSLKCAQQHKKWAQCSGKRDATVKVGHKELLAGASFDNDYNFLTGIERAIEGADREVIHKKGLLPRRSERGPHHQRRPQLEEPPLDQHGKIPEGATMFDPDRERRKEMVQARNYANRIATKIQNSSVVMKKAPAGMQRSKDNQTSISHSRCLNWQVEWITDDGDHKLDKILETLPLGRGYEEVLVRRERAAMTAQEINSSKKRKLKEHHKENVKRQKLEKVERSRPISASSYLQNAKTLRWNVPSSKDILPGQLLETTTAKRTQFQSPYYFYLLRPFTPSSQPKVLIPLDPTKPLTKLLHGQVVLEFPTIYVSTKKPKDMPKSFMMEKAFLAGERRDIRKCKGKEKGKGLVDYSDSETESNSDSDSASDTNSDASSAAKTDSSADSESGQVKEDSSGDSADEDDSGGDTSWSESETADEDGNTNVVDV